MTENGRSQCANETNIFNRMKLQIKLKMTTILILLLCGFSFCSDSGKESNGEKPPGPEKPVTGDVIVYITTNTRSQDFKKQAVEDRKSTRLNSSHVRISYAVFCL